MGSPMMVTDGSWDADVLDHAGTAMVALLGSSSLTCEAFGRVLDAVSASAVGVRLLTLDVEANPRTARRYDISVLPTVLVFRGGALQYRLVGTRSPEGLWNEVSPHLA